MATRKKKKEKRKENKTMRTFWQEKEKRGPSWEKMLLSSVVWPWSVKFPSAAEKVQGGNWR
jgi:hypothetical protein